MRKQRKLFALILVVALQVAGMASISTSAAQQGKAVEEYIISVIPSYLKAYGFDLDGISYSNPYPVLNAENDATMYFFKRENSIIAKMLVIKKGNSYSSRFDTSVDFFNELYYNNISFALTASEDEVCIVCEKGLDFLETKRYNINVISEISEEASPLAFENELFFGSQARMNPEIVSLSGVRSMGGNNASGICWAISVAMMVNYKKGTAYTGSDIVSQCSNSSYVKLPGYGNPSGTIEWVRAAYSLNQIQINDNAGGLAYGRLYYLLSNDKPVHMDFYRKSNGTAVGHAVVLCGTYWDGNTLVYTFCDPNYADDKVAVSQDKAAYDDATKVKFVTKTGTEYNECTHAYYY